MRAVLYRSTKTALKLRIAEHKAADKKEDCSIGLHDMKINHGRAATVHFTTTEHVKVSPGGREIIAKLESWKGFLPLTGYVPLCSSH